MTSCRRIPFTVALKHKNRACAALLNPAAAEPLVWPSPLKFISELNPDAKALLERALMEANMEREKAILKETVSSDPSPLNSDVDVDDKASEVTCLFFSLLAFCFYFKSSTYYYLKCSYSASLVVFFGERGFTFVCLSYCNLVWFRDIESFNKVF